MKNTIPIRTRLQIVQTEKPSITYVQFPDLDFRSLQIDAAQRSAASNPDGK